MKFNQQIGVLLLVLLLASQAFKAPIVYISFKIQQDYIAQNLCKNRNKTITVCYGQCVLRKELKRLAETDHDKPAKPNITTNVDIPVFDIIYSEKVSHSIWSHFKKILNPAKQTLFSQSFVSDFFIPPQL